MRIRWRAQNWVLGLVALILTALGFGMLVGVGAMPGDDTLISAQAGPTNTPAPGVDPRADPILDAQSAISRSMALLPQFTWTDSHAVLLERIHLANAWWSEDAQEGEWLPKAPLWLVGLLADPSTTLTVGDTISPSGLPVSDSTPVVGAFFIFDANLGHLASSGALSASGDFTWAKLLSLQDDSLAIVPATAVPTPDW